MGDVIDSTQQNSTEVFLQCQESNHRFYVPFGKTIAEDELRIAIIGLVKHARVQIKAR